METGNYLVLSQSIDSSEYNDFIGKYYHFPGSEKKNYLNFFKNLPLEFVYYDPEKTGKGEFFGYGKITKPPFKDKREKDSYFIEIEDYKQFSKPVFYKNSEGKKLEEIYAPDKYNPQNSVRRTTKKFIDEVCLDGGINLNFKADAHLVEVLGEQLIESEKVGILELIKNSLDAGATYCKVKIENVNTLPPIENNNSEFKDLTGPVITIEDDGIGMSMEIIENGWLRPATTLKTNVKQLLKEEKEKAFNEGKLSYYNSIVEQLKSSYKGRIPLGEKGVGRFATHRLGNHLIIRTKTSDVDYELVLRINWDDFNSSNSNSLKDLSSVKISLTREPVSRDYGKTKSGTQLVIYGGRKNFTWDSTIIQDINYSINVLNSPNPNPKKIRPSFLVIFQCPQLGELPHEPLYREFKPTFTFEGLVNENGVLETGTMNFNPLRRIPIPPDTFKYDDYDLKVGNPYWLKHAEPKCGAFYFHFDVWYRDKEWIEEPQGLEANDLFKYLENYGGISIYRDNVLILPAEWANKTDWYHLRQKQIKQAYRISYYHMVANIEIDQLDNPDLTDKTSREGLLENRQLKDIKELILKVIQLLEIKYIAFRDQYTSLTKGITRDPIKLNDTIKQQRKLLKNIDNYYPIEDDPYKLFHQIVRGVEGRKERLVNLDNSLKNLKASLELMEEVQDLLKEKAAYGISVAVSVHEIAKITSNFYHGISTLLKSDNIDRVKLEDLQKASLSLQSELKRLSPLRAIRSEKPSEFIISDNIKFVYEVFRRKLTELNIKFSYNSEDIKIFGRYGTMNQILTNLFDNSIYWLQFTKKNTREIQIKIDKDERTLVFADNGPGISDAIKNHLFEAGYSLKVPPSGLGLYICKYYMNSLDGDIYETHKRERINSLGSGAQFTLDFENVPSRKEEAK